MTAYNIFNQSTDFQAIEMIYPTEIMAVDDILIYLCGQVIRIHLSMKIFV